MAKDLPHLAEQPGGQREEGNSLLVDSLAFPLGKPFQKPHGTRMALLRCSPDVLQAFLPVLLHAVAPVVDFAQEVLGIGISLLRYCGEQFQSFLHILVQDGPLGIGFSQQVCRLEVFVFAPGFPQVALSLLG